MIANYMLNVTAINFGKGFACRWIPLKHLPVERRLRRLAVSAERYVMTNMLAIEHLAFDGPCIASEPKASAREKLDT